MNVDAFVDMFPALTRVQIQELARTHRTEDSLVTACIELEEKQGGVASAGVAAASPSIVHHSPAPPLSPASRNKVHVPSHGHIPDYWEDFWRSHQREFPGLEKEHAEHALFFDRHFTETPESEGKQEMLNVLRRLAKHH